MKKIDSILVQSLKITNEQTKENLTMDDVDEWDSLTHMSLIVAIENDFGIELSGDDIAEMTSFSAIKTTIAKYI